MTQIKILLMLILLSKVAFGQSKHIDIQKDDTSFYNYHVKISNLLKLHDLRLTTDSFNIRIWSEKQCIDMSFKDNSMESYTYFFATPYPEKQKRPLVYQKNTLNAEQTQRLLFLIDSFSVVNFRSDSQIECWGQKNGSQIKRSCNDGITYRIETASESTYYFKSFECPTAWDCEEANQISEFIKEIERTLDTDKQFKEFINVQKPGCYNTGSFYNICNDKVNKENSR